MKTRLLPPGPVSRSISWPHGVCCGAACREDAERYYNGGSMHYFWRDCSELSQLDADTHCELMRCAGDILAAAPTEHRRIRPEDVAEICRVLRAVIARPIVQLAAAREGAR